MSLRHARRVHLWLFFLFSNTLFAQSQVLVVDPGDTLRGLGVDVQAGDRIESLPGKAGAAETVLDPFDLWRLELERAAFGSVQLTLHRGDNTVEVDLPGGRWDWQLRYDPSATDTLPGSTARLRAWELMDNAEKFALARKWPESTNACDQARQADPGVQDLVIERCWQLSETNPDRKAGVTLGRALVEVREHGAAPPLARARARLALARSAFTARDYVESERSAQIALDLAGGENNANTVSAGALQVLGFVAYRQGAPAEALRRYRQSERLLVTVAPGSVQYAAILGAIATAHGSLGDLDTAVSQAESAIERMRQVAPGHMSLGRLQFNAGLMAFERGRLADAERHLGEAMATFAQASPTGPEAAMSRAQLAQTLERRGESRRAEVLLRAAVDAGAAVDPNSYETLSMRLQLAIALIGQQRPGDAESETSAVVAATRGDRSDTLHADALSLRADILLARGEAASALVDADAAIDLLRPRERLIQLAPVLIQRGDALRRLGRFDEADTTLAEALTLRQRYAPHTSLEAEALVARARLHRDRGDSQAAIRDFSSALDSLESQRDLLGGDEESRSRWAARIVPFYQDALAQWLAIGDFDQAWALLDRYRAREFLASLGQRRANLIAALPVDLREETRAIAEDYLRAQKMAQTGSPPPDHAFATLKQRNYALEQKLVAANPRLANLAQPQPASAGEVSAALPNDVALISFAVLPERAWAFVLRHGAQSAVAIGLDVDAATLTGEIDAFRLLLTVPGAGQSSRLALLERSRALYRQLLAPLNSAIGDANRLYIIPDGPLHRLPFAALIDGTDEVHYLVERFDISTLVSASAYLATRLPPPAPVRNNRTLAILAVTNSDEAGVALPAAREEAEAIRALFGADASLRIDRDVTAQDSLADLQQSRIVHFASHAVVDPTDPLNSFLRMGSGASPQLSAWDVMRAGAVQADLVTLSACDSALGMNAGGEGLIGLTRAFQYAGVRSVVATLWRVADASTAQLMVAFYSGLAQGIPRDRALSAAQRRMIRSAPSVWQRLLGVGNDFSDPYFWSGVVLTGAPN